MASGQSQSGYPYVHLSPPTHVGSTYPLTGTLSVCEGPTGGGGGPGCNPDEECCYGTNPDGSCCDPFTGCATQPVQGVAPGPALACKADGGNSYVSYDPVSFSMQTAVPQISSLNPNSGIIGTSGQFTVTGSNLVDAFGNSRINFYGSGVTGSIQQPASANQATVNYTIDANAPAGPGNVSVSTNWGESDFLKFTVNPANSAPPQGPIPDPCAVTSNPQVGYTSIVSTGTAGGSGTVEVSFSGSAFAGVTPIVTYGPYSTPSSIAASIAALITRNYLQYGLSAKAFGPNVVYNGSTALGAVSNVVSADGGATPSITTSTSAGTASTVQTVCRQAPSAPPPAVETTVIAWIDGDAIKLPPGGSPGLQSVFPAVGPWPVGSIGYAACELEVASLVAGNLLFASNTAEDMAYANAWLLKYSGNRDPGPSIIPSNFTSFNYQYRLFADFSPYNNIARALIGYTPEPCGTPGVYVQGDAYPQNQQTGTSSQLGLRYLLAETRVGLDGQEGWLTLNGNREIPWVWSVIEFTQDGKPTRFQKITDIVGCGGVSTTVNYQIFPTYSVYMTPLGGKVAPLYTTIHANSVAAFTNLPPGQELDASCIP